MNGQTNRRETKGRWRCWRVLFVWALCLASLYCARTDDGEAIQALIAEGAAGAEKHDLAAILDLCSEDIRAMPGDLDRRSIKGILWRTFQYYGPLAVLYPRPDIGVHEETQTATAQLPFLIVKREQAFPELEKLRDDPLAWLDEIGEHADLYRLKLELSKQHGTWLVRRTHLARFTGLGFKE